MSVCSAVSRCTRRVRSNKRKDTLILWLQHILRKCIFCSASSAWVPAGSPNVASQTTLQLIAAQNTAVNVKRYSFALTGPDHTNLFISPYAGSQIINSTITGGALTPSPVPWRNQPTYFVLFGSANLTAAVYRFTLDVQTNVTFAQPSIEIAAVGHVNHDDELQTPEFRGFLGAFPRWAHVTPWMSSYESWTF